MLILPNFVIPKNLYRDLKSQATRHHNTLAEETRERLTITLNPMYSYNDPSSYVHYRIKRGALRQYLNYPEKIKFDYIVARKTSDIFTQIQQKTGYKDDTLVNEIVVRLAYAMNDPFYEEFRDREVIPLRVLFLISPQIHDHRVYCVSFRVPPLLHKPDFPLRSHSYPSLRGGLRTHREPRVPLLLPT